MKKILKISATIVGCVIFISVLATGIWYKTTYPLRFNNNKYFDLCIADEFFKDRTNQEYDLRSAEALPQSEYEGRFYLRKQNERIKKRNVNRL